MGQHHARTSRARPDARASRSRPGRSARVSATRSAWRWPRRIWPRATTARVSTIIDHFTYALVSDGDLMEGVASEAASLAGHLQLGKLIYLYDDNHVTLSAGTDITFTEDRARRFEAYGWHTQSIEDGNDLAAIERALRAARDETDASVADPGAHASRLRLAAQAGHVRSAWLAARRGRSARDQAESRLARRNRRFSFRSRRARIFARRSNAAHAPKRNGTRRFAAYAKAFPDPARELQQVTARRIARRLGCGHSGLPGRREGHGHARRSGKVMNAIAPRLRR